MSWSWRVLGFQSQTVRSQQPQIASQSPLGEKTAEVGLVGPTSTPMERCVATPHSRVKDSRICTEMSRAPSGEKDGQFTQVVVPWRATAAGLGSGSQTLT